jgi:ADP-heptose:LPS heptosyltransferase
MIYKLRLICDINIGIRSICPETFEDVYMKDSKNIRYIDKYFGRAICLLFSSIHLFKFGRGKKEIKNILVIELFEMGAAVMIYPSLKYIKESKPDTNIYSLTLTAMKECWKMIGIINEDNIFCIEDKNIYKFTKSLLINIIKLRKRNIDLIIDYELFMRVPAIISFLVKSRYRAGFYKYQYEGLYRGNFYDYKCAFNQNTHIAKNFLALTKTAINNESEYPNYKNHINSSELVMPEYINRPDLKKILEHRIKTKFDAYNNQKIILVSHNVGENLSIRNYPIDMLIKVIKMLLDKYNNHIVLLVGTKADYLSGAYIEKKVNNNRCINFSGDTRSLSEFLELLNISDLLITNDNGPEHFASITKTKTIALFSTDSPFIYGPIGKTIILYEFFQCSPCISALNHKNSKCSNNLCLKAINPEKVFESAVELIENNELYFGTINGHIPYY